MKKKVLWGILILVAVSLPAAAQDQSKAQVQDLEAYKAEIDSWHAERIRNLTEPTGYLTLIGLYWLNEGENRFGSDPENQIILPSKASPPFAGTITVRDGEISIKVMPEAEVKLRGEPVTETVINSDRDGLPDVLTVKELSFLVLDRSGRLAVRVKDPQAETRTGFKGVERFPVNLKYRVEAELVPYDPPKQRMVPTVIGTDSKYLVPGLVRFKLDGVVCELEPVVFSPESQMLFFIFGDATNGKDTYAAGRFLYIEREHTKDGRLVVDFNKAVNPPCAFTHHATCPLPPPGNILKVRIEAGERRYGEGHH
jgi:uncharacterized protein (DUF1684 family)